MIRKITLSLLVLIFSLTSVYGQSKGKKKNKAERLDLDDDDRNLQGPFRIINNTANEDL